MFMYMNRFKIHKQFTKRKQKSNTNTFYIKFITCESNSIDLYIDHMHISTLSVCLEL